jgi:hypothetical protein
VTTRRSPRFFMHPHDALDFAISGSTSIPLLDDPR